MTGASTRPISFLVYAARSGSTFLARVLADSTADLLVMPEFRLPYFLLMRPEERVRRLGPDGLRRLVAMDPQFQMSLGLSDEDLEDFVASAGNLGTRGILEYVAGLYGRAVGSQASHVVLKLGGVLAFRPDLTQRIPGARYVHVVRDPRGVVSSLLHTEKAFYPGEDMGRGDVVHCAKGWTRHMSQIDDAVAADMSLLAVRYERLVADPDAEVDRILGFLGAGRSAGARYYSVGKHEESLHSNVAGPPLPARVGAWETELAAWQGLAIEWLTRRRLATCGYVPWFRPRSARPAVAGALAWAWLVHVWASTRYVARRVGRLWRRPGLIWEMARLRWSRWHN